MRNNSQSLQNSKYHTSRDESLNSNSFIFLPVPQHMLTRAYAHVIDFYDLNAMGL